MPSSKALTLGVVALLVVSLVPSVLLWRQTVQAREVEASSEAALSRLRQEIQELSDHLGRAREAVETLEREQSTLGSRMTSLSARLQDGRPQRPDDRDSPATDGSSSRRAKTSPSPESGGTTDPDEPPLPSHDEFLALLDEVLGDDYEMRGSPEAQERFWRLARETDLVPELVARLEETVTADPGNLDARLDLADAYVARLLTVPAGPERGTWGVKAEEQWQEVLRQDPENWEARFSLGNNFTYYPEFMNKGKIALEHLEKAREIQERGDPLPEHASTYLALARVYQGKEQTDLARQILEQGLARHPDHEGLQDALEALEP